MPVSAAARDLLALTLVPGLGPRLIALLLERFGSAAAVRLAPAAELARIKRLSPEVATALSQAFADSAVADELALLERFGVDLVCRDTPDYPTTLAQLPALPPILYRRGTLVSADANAIAIVGTRTPTPYGRRMTERYAAGLVRAGFTVISGLARGIDGIAHRAALDAGGRTVAVLAGGLSRIYPPEHAELAEAVAGNGCLLTESRMDQEPIPRLFPARNRIVSGLSRAVVVVEAGERSGALITAQHAIEQNREVYAVPGPVDAPESAGCLQLLRDGAGMIRSVDDLLADLGGLPLPRRNGPRAEATLFDPAVSAPAAQPVVPMGPPPGLDEAQLRIWEALAEPCDVDTLSARVDVPMAALQGLLMRLELKRIVRRLPGSIFERQR